MFLKSKKIKSSLNIIPKIIFIIKIIAFYNASTTPNKFHPLECYPNEKNLSLNFVQSEITYCKIKEEHYLGYALSNLKHLLSGDIELNPGPCSQLCSICNGLVNKRSLFCSNCPIAVHKKCEKSRILGNNFICKNCRFDNHDLGELLFHEISLLVDLEDLDHIGFSKSAISWFKSYLSNRSFTVNIEDDYSDPGDLNCGVPQGSILGPYFFFYM